MARPMLTRQALEGRLLTDLMTAIHQELRDARQVGRLIIMYLDHPTPTKRHDLETALKRLQTATATRDRIEAETLAAACKPN